MKAPVCTWPGHVPGDPKHDLILAFLTMDIQKSPVWTDELLQHLQAVKSGAIPTWERPGNAYCLSVYPDFVEIEEEYSDAEEAKTQIPLETFLAAVQAWQQMIAKNR